MSDTGLYSNWYERIRTIAELVDQALLELQAKEPKRKSSMILKDVLNKTQHFRKTFKAGADHAPSGCSRRRQLAKARG